MAKPSAFRILSVLSNIERKKLLNFLQTRFFSNRKELAPLQQAWQRMQGKPLDEEKLFRAALPKKKFNKRDWYLLLSRLQDATETFLGLQLYRDDQMPPGMVAPYQVKLESGGLIYAPADEDELITRA